jgi:hypothetical protein
MLDTCMINDRPISPCMHACSTHEFHSCMFDLPQTPDTRWGRSAAILGLKVLTLPHRDLKPQILCACRRSKKSWTCFSYLALARHLQRPCPIPQLLHSKTRHCLPSPIPRPPQAHHFHSSPRRRFRRCLYWLRRKEAPASRFSLPRLSPQWRPCAWLWRLSSPGGSFARCTSLPLP